MMPATGLSFPTIRVFVSSPTSSNPAAAAQEELANWSTITRASVRRRNVRSQRRLLRRHRYRGLQSPDRLHLLANEARQGHRHRRFAINCNWALFRRIPGTNPRTRATPAAIGKDGNGLVLGHVKPPAGDR